MPGETSLLKADILLEGLAFPEAPRWRAHRLWFTDQHARAVMAVDLAGRAEVIARTADLPGGLGWLPDGSALVVGMTQRAVWRLEGGRLRPYADLSRLASFHCNDMLVDGEGRAYVGNFGYDLHAGAPQRKAELICVRADGTPVLAAADLVFPNGMVISPGGTGLIVAETFASRLTRYERDAAGGLGERRVWADLGRHTPDGICLDAEGALWVASPGTGALFRVREGGAISDRIETVGTPYACMLGGEDRRTLFICTSETDDPATAAVRRSGRIEVREVPVPGAGLP